MHNLFLAMMATLAIFNAGVASADNSRPFSDAYVGGSLQYVDGSQSTNLGLGWRNLEVSTPLPTIFLSDVGPRLQAGWWGQIGSSSLRYGFEMNVSQRGGSGAFTRSTSVAGYPVGYGISTELGPSIEFRLQAGWAFGRNEDNLLYAFVGVGAQNGEMCGILTVGPWSDNGCASGWGVSQNFGFGYARRVSDRVTLFAEIGHFRFRGRWDRNLGDVTVFADTRVDTTRFTIGVNFALQ